MFGLGTWELLIILGVVLVVFGPKRLPELGKALGRGIRNFKKGVNEIDGEAKDTKDKKDDPLLDHDDDETPPTSETKSGQSSEKRR